MVAGERVTNIPFDAWAEAHTHFYSPEWPTERGMVGHYLLTGLVFAFVGAVIVGVL